MRSRMSRGVPEWSGGKELYIESEDLAIGSVPGITGNVTGPPEGFRGSTGRGHPSRGATWAAWGREPAPGGLAAPPSLGPMRLGLRGNPRGGAPLGLGGKPPSPLSPRPPHPPLDGF